MADIISIATAVPGHCHKQSDILSFMQDIYGLNDYERRKLKFLYEHSGIDTRYSVIGDFSKPEEEWDFIPADPQEQFPSLEKRMSVYENAALDISKQATKKCLNGHLQSSDVTHLITVSCTGMSAPGLDLQLVKALQFPTTIFRSSVNFMGCYAAVHALKLAKMICDSTPNSNVVIVAAELCTLHFQQDYTEDNAASSLLFSDGAAAVLMSNTLRSPNAFSLQGFYSQVAFKGEADMAWQLGSQGFLMTLSGYIPQLISEDINQLVEDALSHHGLEQEDIAYWCIHPGGKRILDLIQKQLQLSPDDLCYSREILRRYGNMSSPTVLFVLKYIMEHDIPSGSKLMGMAFGPGLTMETFIAERK
ncbi:MAG: type III polyketide synthase [Chitinophagaceae bacterium]|nr:type III polyketide synthase [Chitinophagaceae bacterium]